VKNDDAAMVFVVLEPRFELTFSYTYFIHNFCLNISKCTLKLGLIVNRSSIRAVFLGMESVREREKVTIAPHTQKRSPARGPSRGKENRIVVIRDGVVVALVMERCFMMALYIQSSSRVA
jgi:hypothetical protein